MTAAKRGLETCEVEYAFSPAEEEEKEDAYQSMTLSQQAALGHQPASPPRAGSGSWRRRRLSLKGVASLASGLNSSSPTCGVDQERAEMQSKIEAELAMLQQQTPQDEEEAVVAAGQDDEV